MTETYTIEQFELDFENAANINSKREVLANAIDILDVSDPEVKETISKYREELKDLVSDMAIEEDARCNKDIDSGELELYTCIKEVDGFTKGHNYYVKVDGISSVLSDKWSEVGSDLIKSVITNMKPLIWIYSDNGLGTLKKKNTFDKVFSEYFVKFENK